MDLYKIRIKLFLDFLSSEATGVFYYNDFVLTEQRL